MTVKLWSVRLESSNYSDFIFEVGAKSFADAIEYAKIWLLEEGKEDLLDSPINLNFCTDCIGETDEEGILIIKENQKQMREK